MHLLARYQPVQQDGKTHEAKFAYHGQAVAMLYTADGKLLESSLKISAAQFPKLGILYVQHHCASADVEGFWRVTKSDHSVCYKVEFHQNTVYFDLKGRFVKLVNN